MLGRLFKPRWQHTNPAIRLKAVAQLNGAEETALLAQLARGDASESVRAAAAGKLTDLSLLDEVYQRDEAPQVRQAASARIMALLAGTCDDAPAAETRLRLIRLTGNQQALRHIAEHSPDDTSRLAAVERLGDDAQLFELAVYGQGESLRIAAATRIQDLTLLKRLGREGRDKRVIRQARDQAKALQRQQQEAQAQSAKVVNLANSLEQHAGRTVDALYGPRLEKLEQQWQECRQYATDELTERIQRALLQCRRLLAEQQEQHRQQALNETARAEREAAAHSLYQLLSQANTETWDQQLGELRSALATQQRRWESACEYSAPRAEEEKAFTDLVSAFEKMLDLATQTRDAEDTQLTELVDQWPREYAMPSRLEQALQARQTRQDAPAAAAATPRRRGTPHQGLVVALKRELRQGNLRHANRLWQKAEALVHEQQDSALASQLRKLESRRDELQDWHAFAAEPKKQQLCEQMEALQQDTMDPPQRASAIQALHDEWRALMSSDKDQDQALWERFKDASDRAYDPCREHFAELDAVKAENLEKRRHLCDQLDTFISQQDWQQADWPGVWQIRQQAPRDWKALHPIRFTEGRDLQKRFSALLSQLDEKLDEAIADAQQARQALLAQASALLEEEDVEQAARQAQSLQQQWRQSPWLPPAKHRTVQKKFRTTMDKLFSARNAYLDARRESRQEEQKALQHAIKSLEAELQRPLAETDPASLKEAEDNLDQAAQGSLPREWLKRHRQLTRQISQRRDQLKQWQRWHALETRLDALPRTEQDTEAALDLAVAMEVLADVASPEDQRQRRMAWQLGRLSGAMTKQQGDHLDDAEALLKEHDDGGTEPLITRLRQALAALEPGQR